MNSEFGGREISYILKEKCGEVAARRSEHAIKWLYMIELGKSRAMSQLSVLYRDSMAGTR